MSKPRGPGGNSARQLPRGYGKEFAGNADRGLSTLSALSFCDRLASIIAQAWGLGKVNVAGSEKNELQEFRFGSEIENGYDTNVLAGSRKRQRSEDPHPWLTSAHDR